MSWFHKRNSDSPEVEPVDREHENFLWTASMSDDRYFIDKNFYTVLSESPEAVAWTGKNGRTALMEAARNGQAGHVALLIDKGADVNAKDQSGDTALILASRVGDSGQAAIIARLLDGGADINAANAKGETALIAAVQERAKRNAELLLQRDADMTCCDKAGQTALQTAEARFDKASTDTATMFGALNNDAPLIDLLKNTAKAREEVTELRSGAEHEVVVRKPLQFKKK